MLTEINFVLGKNGAHEPNSLGGRSMVVVRQAGRQMKILQLAKFLKFNNFNVKARLACLNGSLYEEVFGSLPIYIYYIKLKSRLSVRPTVTPISQPCMH